MEKNGLNHLLCHADSIDLVWPSVVKYVQAAVNRCGLPEFLLYDAYKDVKENRAELWVFHDENRVWGIVIGRMRTYNEYPLYELYVTAGDEMHRWTDKIVVIEEHARERGALRLDIYGRRGWLKVFKDQNFVNSSRQ